MPHVEIKCFPGRTEEQKQICAEKLTEVVAETLGCRISSVSIAIREIAEEDWKTEVWDREIVPAGENLYKKPGYSYE